MPRLHKAFLGIIPKTFGILFFVFFSYFIVKSPFFTSSVSAENLFFYPQFCLGGWEKPQHASGEATLELGSDFSLYNKDNSAYLESSVASQLFCGYFSIDEKEKPPASVSVIFNWAPEVEAGHLPIIVDTDEDRTDEEMITEVELDNSASSTVRDEEKTETSTSSRSEKLPTGVIGNQSKEDMFLENNFSSENEEQAIENKPAENVPGGEQSFLKKLFNRAHAQEYFGLAPFFDVSYSMDGVRWISIGKVNQGNMAGHAVLLPINSWEDLKKIQIMVSVIPTIDEKPAVYLESMYLSVDYDRSVTETVTDSIEDIAVATDTLVAAIINVDDWVPDIFKKDDDEDNHKSLPEIVEEKTLVVVESKRLSFELEGDRVKTERILPWYSESFKEELTEKDIHFTDLDIKTSENQRSLLIHGICVEKYFVMLLFRESEDYLKKPNTFAWNAANVCTDGKFFYDLRALSTDIEEGKYYLLVAEEAEEGPWVPISDLVMVRIIKTIEKKIIE